MAKLFSSASALIGTIVGAGFLGMPYVISRSGFSFGLLNMIIVAIIMLICFLYIGEIVLRTKKTHQLAGYAEKYLGKKGKILMIAVVGFGIYSALIAYLIAEGESLSYLFFKNFEYSLLFSIGLWIIFSGISYFGLKSYERQESLGLIMTLAAVSIISILFFKHIEMGNLVYSNSKLIFYPFGVVLFAFLGFSGVPEIARILKNEKHLLKKTILISIISAFVLYLIFAFIVIGYKGQQTPEIASLALGWPFIILGIITMFNAYVANSMAIMDSIRFDFKRSKTESWLYTILVPLIIFIILRLTNNDDFIKILGIGGVVSGGLSAILILIMVKAAKKKGDRKPEYSIPYSTLLAIILAIIFISAIFLEIF